MKANEYAATQVAIIQLGRQIKKLPLEAFIKIIVNSETLSPMIDPTLFMKAQDNLRAVKKLAKAFKEVQEAFAECEETVFKTAVRENMLKVEPNENDGRGNPPE